MTKPSIPLNKHDLNVPAIKAMMDVVTSSQTICGGGKETTRCQRWIKNKTGTCQTLLTPSCTDALEMAALLADLVAGDEVIMPSFTFSSTATAVVLRGAIPVFVDIRPDTLNIDETLIENAITKRTRAICPVHYAGVGCDMDAIMRLAKKHKLLVIEDAAQGFGATYKGHALGSIGDLGTYSFHDSKVITAGEGGALMVNRPRFAKRSEILWEKGTNRSQLIRGEVNKYTWVDVGSSFLMSDLTAALLYTQLKVSSDLIRERLKRWALYNKAFASLEEQGKLRRPIVPGFCKHNGHIYYILLEDQHTRDSLRAYLAKHKIESSFHYIPLHSSPAGRKFGRTATKMPVTDRTSRTLLRLPLFAHLGEKAQRQVISHVFSFFDKMN